MEPDEIKAAWQALNARLARQEDLQRELLRGQHQQQAQHQLRPLRIGLLLQALLGVGLVLLGVGCWRTNPGIPGLLATGIALHAFGVLHIVFAVAVLTLAAGIRPASAVLTIQRRLRALLRLQRLNSAVCGAPWWIGWVLVVIGFAGLSPNASAGPTPAWIWISLAVGVLGTALTWIWAARAARKPQGLYARMDDGADGIRRSLKLVDELDRFEQE